MADYIFADRRLIKQLRDDNSRRLNEALTLLSRAIRSHKNFYIRIKKSGGAGVPKHAANLFDD